MLTPAATKISVLIVDDHPLLRTGVRALIEKTPDLCVAGEAENGDEAKKLLDELRPNVILLDLKIPHFSPTEFQEWVQKTHTETTTLVLTAHDRDIYLVGMMDRGAVGLADKSARAETLIAHIRDAASGKLLFTPEQVERAIKWRRDVGDKWAKLTEREREVLLLMEQGLSNKAIAEQLGITLKTVAFRVSAIFDRLDVGSRHEAVAWYQKHFCKDLV
jgi:DNA-binding NarL/FixJ family response regulator